MSTLKNKVVSDGDNISIDSLSKKSVKLSLVTISISILWTFIVFRYSCGYYNMFNICIGYEGIYFLIFGALPSVIPMTLSLILLIFNFFKKKLNKKLFKWTYYLIFYLICLNFIILILSLLYIVISNNISFILLE